MRTKENLEFNVDLMMFATNDQVSGINNLDGYLGLSPCPDGLTNNKYSFAKQLLEYYKGKNWI